MECILDGLTIHYERKGSGPVLLLVHGLGSPLVWDRLFDPLTKSFDTIVVDLPGFGLSDVPPEPYTTDRYVLFLRHFLDAQSLHRVNLAGVSYGGEIAASLAASDPGRIGKLILIASSGLGPKNAALLLPPIWFCSSFLARSVVLRYKPISGFFSRFAFYDIHSRPDDLVERFHQSIIREGRRETWIACARNTLRCDPEFFARLKSIHVTTLLIWGKNDRVVPPRFGEAYRRAISDSQLVFIEKCGHALPLEKPEELRSEMEKFLIGKSG